MPRDILHAACEVKRKSQSWVQLFGTPWTIQSMEFSRPEYWSGYPSLLQGIFQTQGSNPGLPHCRQILYQLSYKGSPRILEWVAYPFSSRSFRPRKQTGVSCIASRFFTNWAMTEAHNASGVSYIKSFLESCRKDVLHLAPVNCMEIRKI